MCAALSSLERLIDYIDSGPPMQINDSDNDPIVPRIIDDDGSELKMSGGAGHTNKNKSISIDAAVIHLIQSSGSQLQYPMWMLREQTATGKFDGNKLLVAVEFELGWYSVHGRNNQRAAPQKWRVGQTNNSCTSNSGRKVYRRGVPKLNTNPGFNQLNPNHSKYRQ